MKRFLLFLALGLTMTLSAQNTPVPANTDGWLHYDSDDATNWGLVNKWAIVLPAHSFAGKLTKATIYTREGYYYYDNTFTLTIVEGGDTPDQGTQRSTREVPVQSEEGWIDMLYPEPLTFDENNNVWLVFERPGTLQGGIAAQTNSPAAGVSGTGCYMYQQSSHSWTASSYFYKIRAYFETWEFPENTIFSWDFEDGNSGWYSDDAENSSWKLGQGDYWQHLWTHSGVKNFQRLAITYEKGKVDMLASPQLDLSNYTDVKLGFWRLQRPNRNDIDTLRIYYRESPSVPDWILIETYSEDTGIKWKLEEGIELPSPSSTYQIGFEYKDNRGFGIALDDIYITGTPLPDPDDSEPDTEGIEEVLNQKSTIKNQKWMIDGQLFILRDGKIFNAQGARVR